MGPRVRVQGSSFDARWFIFKLLVLGSWLKGSTLSNESMGAKIATKSAQMEAWRVQNGDPMAQDGPGGAQMPPKGPQRSTCGAWSAPSGVPESPRSARARFCVRFWGPKGAEREPKSHPKANTKRYQKDLRFRSSFRTDFYRLGGPESITFGT